MISADTNVFVYAVDEREPAKRRIASTVLRALEPATTLVGLQVVGEYQNALRKRLRVAPGVAYETARSLLDRFPSFAYDEAAVEIALGQALLGRLSYWDALLLAAADRVGVRVMVSEDMADGLRFGGVEVINPFGSDGPSARIRDMLALDL